MRQVKFTSEPYSFTIKLLYKICLKCGNGNIHLFQNTKMWILRCYYWWFKLNLLLLYVFYKIIRYVSKTPIVANMQLYYKLVFLSRILRKRLQNYEMFTIYFIIVVFSLCSSVDHWKMFELGFVQNITSKIYETGSAIK